MSDDSNKITVAPSEANLKRKIRRHLSRLGFKKDPNGNLIPPASSKENVRLLHSHQRNERLAASSRFLRSAIPSLGNHFASGKDIVPRDITPRLELVKSGTWQAELFRLASLTWSVPVSNGFGRRIRYLVWDEANDKLIGVIALGDPVFNLRKRDELIGWTTSDREERLVNILDAYVLGALPPYNQLLAGKLVACLVRTSEVRQDFHEKYGKTAGIISGQRKKPNLLMITTASALGRSSVYNRLVLGGQPYFRSIGYTGGWGHFHVSEALFQELRAYLRRIDHPYVDAHGYGQGPNWRLRTIRAALDALGFSQQLVRHGIERELFVCELANNSISVLQGKRKRPDFSTLRSVSDVADMARERWLIPRAERRPEFRHWDRSQLLHSLGSQSPCVEYHGSKAKRTSF